MSERPIPDWDPREASVQRDQRAAYDELRERCPVAYSDFLGWSLFRHADIVRVVTDPATYSSASKHLAIPNGMDPPEHARYREALEPYFTPERMAAFEPRCRALAADLARAAMTRGELDFAGDYAEPFALQAECAFLGWPTDTWERLVGWTHGNQQAAFARDREAARTLARELAGYVMEAIDARRARDAAGADDLTARLMAARVDDRPLGDEDIVSILRNWIAGHGTVAAALGLAMLHIARRADLQRQLRREPRLLPGVIEELLRVDGPLASNRRTTTREVEIEGRTIEAGATLTLMWLAANRDPRAFDDPNDVRVGRDQDANLLFGAGIHYCLGAPLARLELRVALEEILARTSSITLAGAPPPRVTYPSDGLTALPLLLA